MGETAHDYDDEDEHEDVHADDDGPMRGTTNTSAPQPRGNHVATALKVYPF